MMNKVALVTGANKGIGFAIVENLHKVFDGDIYLTARDESRGKAAVELLVGRGLTRVRYCRLDVKDEASIAAARDMLVNAYGGLDVLVNNAGISYGYDKTKCQDTQNAITMETNFHGLLAVSRIMFPILRSGARVVHLSSMCSNKQFRNFTEDIRKYIVSRNTIEEVVQAMNRLICFNTEDMNLEEGWPIYGYGLSKMGVTMITPIQQRIIDGDTGRKDIVINSCWPGYVDTDMTNHNGTKTTDEGADTPVYLATLEPMTSIRGVCVFDRDVEDWTNDYKQYL